MWSLHNVTLARLHRSGLRSAHSLVHCTAVGSELVWTMFTPQARELRANRRARNQTKTIISVIVSFCTRGPLQCQDWPEQIPQRRKTLNPTWFIGVKTSCFEMLVEVWKPGKCLQGVFSTLSDICSAAPATHPSAVAKLLKRSRGGCSLAIRIMWFYFKGPWLVYVNVNQNGADSQFCLWT